MCKGFPPTPMFVPPREVGPQASLAPYHLSKAQASYLGKAAPSLNIQYWSPDFVVFTFQGKLAPYHFFSRPKHIILAVLKLARGPDKPF